MRLEEICEFLDSFLKIKDILDTSLNGLQVEGKKEIKRIALSVDASLEAFIKTNEIHADLLIVHHGLFWEKQEPITGILYRRLKVLIENEISLYAAHLPLDMHPSIGNNIRILKLFTEDTNPFGEYHGQKIGFSGRLEPPLNREEIIKKLNDTFNISCRILPFGKEEIETIAVISGGGCDCAKEAVDKNIDLFITGESKLFSWHLAKESELNIVFGGHYATETPGIKGLMEKIKKNFDIPCCFLDIPSWL
ncbi:TPA: Nif3-like dinuclear metal center hexameric protein [bacterium]|nr:Nif3-like dinuclear metal center hexameric protein [bacterium]